MVLKFKGQEENKSFKRNGVIDFGEDKKVTVLRLDDDRIKFYFKSMDTLSPVISVTENILFSTAFPSTASPNESAFPLY